MGDPAEMQLPAGLSSARAGGLSDLIAEITGTRPRALPTLAPALLFADDAVQSRLDMPHASQADILIHDAQSIALDGAFPCDTALAARARRTPKGPLTEFTFTLMNGGSPVASLGTTLRLVPKTDLGAVKPTPFRTGSLTDTEWTGPLTVSQAQTDRYLALSGDANPIHQDVTQAQALGLPAPIVPGLLLLSLIQPAAEAAFPDARLTSLKSRFLAPLCVGNPMRIGLQPRGQTRARAYLIANGDRALAIADLTFQP